VLYKSALSFIHSYLFTLSFILLIFHAMSMSSFAALLFAEAAALVTS